MARENKIICAAVRYKDITIVGVRHFDQLMAATMDNYLESVLPKYIPYCEWTQGFIDRYGEFHNREDALKIAKENGQHINYGRNGSETVLYSEGIY